MRPPIGLDDDQGSFGLFVMACLCWPQTLQLERVSTGTARRRRTEALPLRVPCRNVSAGKKRSLETAAPGGCNQSGAASGAALTTMQRLPPAAASQRTYGWPATASFQTPRVRNGPLDARSIANRPLRVVGNLQVVSGTGRTCNQVARTFLSRFGQSKNKPCFDGSRTATGSHMRRPRSDDTVIGGGLIGGPWRDLRSSARCRSGLMP